MIVFILDALCNGTNGLIQVQERIVLPRTHDVVTDILDLLELLEPPFEIIGTMDWGFELLVVDFSDAVLSILLHEKERGCTVVTDGQCKWFAYRGFPFGLVSGPLVWGRVAAYLARLAQAVSHSAQEARVQTHVDDPLISLAPVNNVIGRLQLRV